jgi:hypothetical protein
VAVAAGMLMVAAVAAGMLMAVAVTASATPIKAANATVMTRYRRYGSYGWYGAPFLAYGAYAGSC